VTILLIDRADCVVRLPARTVTGMSEYDADILVWSEHQAELLRRVAAGQPVNEPPDWVNIIEELEDVGRSELRSCRSLLRQALRHMLKAQAWPLSRDAPTWRADAIDFRRQARDAFTPSMRQKIDVAALYADALRAMPDTIDGQPPLPVDTVCPVTLDELLAED
jgi:hypothetical protein